MFAKTFSAALNGIGAKIIEVEVCANQGLRSFSIVGLADKAIAEAKERVASAVKNIGFTSPNSQAKKVVINLSPADLKKEGSHFDLAIALAYLLATEQTKFSPDKKLFLGELALNADLKPIKGAFSSVLLAQENGFEEIVLPLQNAKEASCVNLFSQTKIKIIPCQTLSQAIAYLENRVAIEPLQVQKNSIPNETNYEIQWHWIKGQEHAKRGLTIAVAGGHNLLLQGPPGTGKTLLAKAAVSIMPALNQKEILELSKIYSACGLLSEQNPVLSCRPFRSPHHTISEPALIGGGNPVKPGEITLAHKGILFLDEFPEFHRDVLESLRQPLEQGEIIVQRTKQITVFPARFSLIAAANPCPCGNRQNPDKECSCTASQIASYKRKLSGPLIDRFDLFCWVPNLKYEELISPNIAGDGDNTKKQVIQARKIQSERLNKDKIATNAEMNVEQIKKYCLVDSASENILRKFVDSGKLSARGFHKVLKIARTIADLSSKENIEYQDVAEALSYRQQEQ
ncbi:MAG: YifB family Mg chelatase-like AAA ATPase [Candidatus Pacebacteria bacterium]|nr:YifB family Mg chelatase-like AAA ATPase [Candidatus Paceibacterota bacterium]